MAKGLGRMQTGRKREGGKTDDILYTQQGLAGESEWMGQDDDDDDDGHVVMNVCKTRGFGGYAVKCRVVGLGVGHAYGDVLP